MAKSNKSSFIGGMLAAPKATASNSTEEFRPSEFWLNLYFVLPNGQEVQLPRGLALDDISPKREESPRNTPEYNSGIRAERMAWEAFRNWFTTLTPGAEEPIGTLAARVKRKRAANAEPEKDEPSFDFSSLFPAKK